MKKLLIIILALSFSTPYYSCQKQIKKQIVPMASFNGIWDDSTNINFKNCYAVYSEIGDSIHMGHYIEFKGQPFFESGSGIIKGDSIIYHVDVIHMIPEWGPGGGTHYTNLNS